MRILLAFAPFVVFVVADRLAGPTAGLVAGALASVALPVRDRVIRGGAPKILEFGTTLLFGGLALYAVLASPSWTVIRVRLYVDSGLLLVVLISLAVGRPFTLQYAREQVAPDIWNSPVFIRTNYVITVAWALAFAAMTAAEFALLYAPDLPRFVGILAAVLALVGAIKFTGWYPEHVRNLRNS